jgi:hypothetical protein
MTSPSGSALSPDRRRAAEQLAADLRRVFGTRFHSLVAYALAASSDPDVPLHTLALVERVTFEDLAACVPLADGWQRRGLAVPLLLGRDEFRRSLDVFAIEYGAIIADHLIVDGANPFEGAEVADADLRRACERQAKSHLIHLREGFLESGNHARAIARLVAGSAPAFRTLLVNIASLDDGGGGTAAGASAEDLAGFAEERLGVPAPLVKDVLASPASGTIVDPTALLARYIEAAERIWLHVDRWGRR